MKTALKFLGGLSAVALVLTVLTSFSSEPPGPQIRFTNRTACDVSVVAIWAQACPCDQGSEHICSGTVGAGAMILLPTSTQGNNVLCGIKVTCDASCNTGSGAQWHCSSGFTANGTCGSCQFTLSGSIAGGFVVQ